MQVRSPLVKKTDIIVSTSFIRAHARGRDPGALPIPSPHLLHEI